MVILLIATLTARRPSRRLAGFALLLVCVLAVSLVSFLAPDTYADRSNPDNVYGAASRTDADVDLFFSHPLLGVGLGASPKPSMEIRTTWRFTMEYAPLTVPITRWVEFWRKPVFWASSRMSQRK